MITNLDIAEIWEALGEQTKGSQYLDLAARYDPTSAEQHHPLAYCQWCRRPVADPLADCPDPLCRDLDIQAETIWKRNHTDD